MIHPARNYGQTDARNALEISNQEPQSWRWPAGTFLYTPSNFSMFFSGTSPASLFHSLLFGLENTFLSFSTAPRQGGGRRGAERVPYKQTHSNLIPRNVRMSGFPQFDTIFKRRYRVLIRSEER